jgi:hypothetical protein
MQEEFSMSGYLDRLIKSPVGAPRAAVLALTMGAAVLATAGLTTSAAAQDAAPSVTLAQGRNEAPIGHRQPRVEDLPPGVVRNEDKMKADQDALDKKLENSICRGC